MGSHRTTIKRKKPLTQRTPTRANRKLTIKALHNDLKAQIPRDSAALASYQQASSRGQDPSHGGDSSKVLVPWVRRERALRVLEVGCLECDNAIAKFVESRGGVMKRIDLKSRDPRIEEVDFMSFPVLQEVLSLKGVLLTVRNSI
jgi:25S rRNA (adenine(2142)-N(1))-methyltransferase, Bmt2